MARGWPDGVEPPTGVTFRAKGSRAPETNSLKLPFLWGLWVYRNAISPLDGSRCGLYPTCSGYATEAIRAHGPLFGGFLAADRLMHEGSARPPEYPVIERFGRTWIHDPVERNDWMFRRENSHGGAGALDRDVDRRMERELDTNIDRGAEPDGVPRSATALGGGSGKVGGASGFSQPVPSSEGEARRLAEHFLRGGDSYGAIHEYRRAAFLVRDPGRGSELLSEAAWISLRAAVARVEETGKDAGRGSGRGAFAEAGRLFEDAEKAAMEAGDGARARKAAYGRAFALLAGGDAFEAGRRFEVLAMETASENQDLLRDARWLAAWAEFSGGLEDGRRAVDAAVAFPEFADDPRRGANARGVIAAVADERVRWRSPRLAAGLSLFVPGAGYVYAGKPAVGAGSFVLNAVFIGGIVLAARDRNWPLAAILLSAEMGWYLGGAGGAADAAMRSNDRRRGEFDRRLRRRFLGGVWPGGAAAALLF